MIRTCGKNAKRRTVKKCSRISQTEKEVLSKAKKGMVGRCRRWSEGNGCQEG
jgi:hypothetical protein